MVVSYRLGPDISAASRGSSPVEEQGYESRQDEKVQGPEGGVRSLPCDHILDVSQKFVGTLSFYCERKKPKDGETSARNEVLVDAWIPPSVKEEQGKGEERGSGMRERKGDVRRAGLRESRPLSREEGPTVS